MKRTILVLALAGAFAAPFAAQSAGSDWTLAAFGADVATGGSPFIGRPGTDGRDGSATPGSSATVATGGGQVADVAMGGSPFIGHPGTDGRDGSATPGSSATVAAGGGRVADVAMGGSPFVGRPGTDGRDGGAGAGSSASWRASQGAIFYGP